MRIALLRTRDSIQRGARGFALVAAIVFLFVILLLGGSMISQAVQEMSNASRIKKETAAFNLAEAGIDYAAWQLYNNGSDDLPTTWTKYPFDGGRFSVTAKQWGSSANTIELTSTGVYRGWTSKVKVVGVFLDNPTGPQNPVFNHALFSDADLTMGGTFDLIGDVHANGNITMRGGPSVDGDVSAMGNIRQQGSADVTGDILDHQPRIPMPAIDLAYYRANATTIIEGDHNFNNDTDLDGITFVDGDATINGRFRGKGVIVVTGSVHINGNASLVNPTDEFAIICAGGVRVNGNCHIEGWIYAHNVEVPSVFEGNGSAEIIGGVAADVIDCSGTLKVTYKQVDVEMPGNNAAPPQFDAVSWRRIK